MFMDEESSDVVFEVGGQRGKDNAEKVARTAPIAFHAHRFILSKCPSTLADMFGPVGEGMIPIQIDNISPETFPLLLNFIYGGSVSDNDMREHAKEIIDAADTFQITNLKLAAEAHFVQATSFRLENMMELLLYAESKNCALLKEAVMDFILENKDEVLNTISFNGVIAPETVIKDVRLINLKRHIDYFSKGPKSSRTARAQKRRLFRVNSILRFCHNDKHETQHVGQLISIKGHTF
jgi:hypothetical protein